MMLRVMTTRGAKTPFPSLTFFIIGTARGGFAVRIRTAEAFRASAARSSPPGNVAAQSPWKLERISLLTPTAGSATAMAIRAERSLLFAEMLQRRRKRREKSAAGAVRE
ncbi:hypothetical protein DJ021_18510, partial [Phenylobacterium hankyongense]